MRKKSLIATRYVLFIQSLGECGKVVEDLESFGVFEVVGDLVT